MDNGIGTLLQFIPSFMSLMKGMNISGQKNTASQLANVNNAMVNPNNPLYQQMYGQYQQQGKQQLGQNISQMEGMNRMLSSMGRTPLFSPERQGEQSFRAQAAMGPQIGLEAGQQTQQALSNAAKSLGGIGGQVGAYSQLGKEQYGPRYQTGADNQSLMGLGQLGNLLNSGKNSQQPTSKQLWDGTGVAAPFPWQQNNGVNAPGAQQNNHSLLSMFGLA